MIHWCWLIVAFVGGVISYGMAMLWGEIRHRKEEARIYERRYFKEEKSVDVGADDFEQELELHKN